MPSSSLTEVPSEVSPLNRSPDELAYIRSQQIGAPAPAVVGGEGKRLLEEGEDLVLVLAVTVALGSKGKVGLEAVARPDVPMQQTHEEQQYTRMNEERQQSS